MQLFRAVSSGESTRPLDAGSVASPFRETEGMPDGSDAIADWPLLNALVKYRRRRIPGQHRYRDMVLYLGMLLKKLKLVG